MKKVTYAAKDTGLIPGNFGRTNGLTTKDNCEIFPYDSFGGYGSQMKNIWSSGSEDNQVAVPDLVPHSLPESGKYSRKVFIGGLPPDVTADLISTFFERFGANTVDWPHRKCTRSDIPPNGYAFVVFISDRSVDYLVSQCEYKQGKLHMVLNNGGKDVKVVQVRPWSLSDQVYSVTDAPLLSNRYSVFIGGVPRTTTASELAMLLQRTIGGVVYVSLEVDIETKYPKGAAQVVFESRESYLTSIAMRLVTLRTVDQVKEIEIKPYLMDCARCEMCLSDARYLCPELCCLLYLCESCWCELHKQRGLLHHKPMTKTKPGSPMRSCVNGFPFFMPSLDNTNHSHSGLRQSNQQQQQQQLCHCRVRETVVQRFMQQYMLQSNFPSSQPPFI